MELFSRLSGVTSYYDNREDLIRGEYYGIFKSPALRFLYREFIVYGNLCIGIFAMKWAAFDIRITRIYMRMVVILDVLFILTAVFRFFRFDSITLTFFYSYLYNLSVSSILFLLISLLHFRK